MNKIIIKSAIAALCVAGIIQVCKTDPLLIMTYHAIKDGYLGK